MNMIAIETVFMQAIIGDRAPLELLNEFSLAPTGSDIIFGTRSYYCWISTISIQVHFDFAFTKPTITVTTVGNNPKLNSKKSSFTANRRKNIVIFAKFHRPIVIPECMKIQYITTMRRRTLKV